MFEHRVWWEESRWPFELTNPFSSQQTLPLVHLLVREMSGVVHSEVGNQVSFLPSVKCESNSKTRSTFDHFVRHKKQQSQKKTRHGEPVTVAAFQFEQPEQTSRTDGLPDCFGDYDHVQQYTASRMQCRRSCMRAFTTIALHPMRA